MDQSLGDNQKLYSESFEKFFNDSPLFKIKQSGDESLVAQHLLRNITADDLKYADLSIAFAASKYAICKAVEFPKTFLDWCRYLDDDKRWDGETMNDHGFRSKVDRRIEAILVKFGKVPAFPEASRIVRGRYIATYHPESGYRRLLETIDGKQPEDEAIADLSYVLNPIRHV